METGSSTLPRSHSIFTGVGANTPHTPAKGMVRLNTSRASLNLPCGDERNIALGIDAGGAGGAAGRQTTLIDGEDIGYGLGEGTVNSLALSHAELPFAGKETGQTLAHSPQAVQLQISTNLDFFWTVTLKLPA